ncbi:hypothetical protein BGW39_003765 [Mortierella sp. 14UC]|nr:hypothetical protein BGW39_003765 [Mortierella sp. 14UC]
MTSPFADDPDIKYGTFWFESSLYTTTYGICNHHVIAMNLTPFDNTFRNAADLDVIVSGSDLGGVWEDEVEIGGMKSNVMVKAYAKDGANIPVETFNLMPKKKTRRLQFTFTGTKPAKMYTVNSFVDNADQKYGVILFETSPYITTYNVCSRHKMYMNLVPIAAEFNSASDLDVVLQGSLINQSCMDTVEIDGESNTVIVQVLKSPKETRTTSVGSRVINTMEITFTGKTKSRLLVSPDPELDCDCENCKSWLGVTNNSFADQPQLKYAFVNFETNPCIKTFDICSNSVMFMSLLDMQVYGSDVGCTWTDEVAIDGCDNAVKVCIKSPAAPVQIVHFTISVGMKDQASQ